MKRSAALTPLSEDHHHALVIASVLNRASAATARSSATLFADFIAEHETLHFGLEESLLLPALPVAARGRKLADRVREDHRYLRAAAREIGTPGEQPSVSALAQIGARLRAHVQLEERELFPYLEDSLAPALLEQIGAQLRDRLAGIEGAPYAGGGSDLARRSPDKQRDALSSRFDLGASPLDA